MSDLPPEVQEAAATALKRMIAGTHCIQCGQEVTHFVQVGRSSYAEPCGCRQGQMKAAAANTRRLETLLKQAQAERQVLYNELYSWLMSESAWEICDELRTRFPALEAVRQKEQEDGNL